MTKRKLVDATVTLFCLFGAYWLHINTFINWDVAWHIEGAKRLLLGGDYTTNVFDGNSPFVFAFFIPVIWLHSLIPIKLVNLTYIYLLAISIIPLILCYRMIDHTFTEDEIIIKRIFYFAIVISILFLPAASFGQREVVLIIFFLPYYLLTLFTINTQHKIKLSQASFILCAIMAAFGIVQNIIYISIALFLDAYKFLKTKKIAANTIIFYSLIVIFLLVIKLLYPTYYRIIIPMVLCYESFSYPLTRLLVEVFCFISLLSVAMILVNVKRFLNNEDIIVAAGTVSLSLLIYFFEGKVWYYHIYPALTFTTILLVFIIIKYYEKNVLQKDFIPHISFISLCLAVAILSIMLKWIISSANQEITLYHNKQSIENRWIHYSNTHFQNKTVFVMSIPLWVGYSLNLYSNAINTQPWSNLWLMPFYVLHPNQEPITKYCNLEADNIIVYKILDAAIQRSDPDYLIVEDTRYHHIFKPGFSFIQYFSKNPSTRDLLRRYFLNDRLEEILIYKKKNVVKSYISRDVS